ncbi:MAG TPA: phospholipase D-like domain-containing protein [Actinomycetota bacterium]|nr:phospholipase D-like domain-containing protein [Actinomycetota bacterium]
MWRARTIRNAVAVAGLGLAAVYAFEAAQYRRTAARGFEVLDPPQPGTADFGRLVEVLTVAPLRQGNRITILRNGCEIFPAMLDAIRAARQTIEFATYVYWTGSIAPEFADALAERAAAGVVVNVLLDAVGAAKMDPALVERLEAAGAHVAWFRPPRWYTLHKLNNRTHRKILVVDGRVGFTGGVGIAEEWTGNCEDPGHWRDTHVRVEGPVVRALLGGFLDNWAEASGAILAGGARLPDLEGFDDGVQAQVTRSTAEKGSTDAEQLFYSAVVGARSRIWLTTAYFAPRRAFVDALCQAVERGVDVRVVTNGPHIDQEVVRQAGHRSYQRLLECGVRLFEYQRTMLHAKTLLVDDQWATVGSINFDNRSFALNDELNISFRDPGLVATLEKHFVQDIEDARELEVSAWRGRPLTARAKEAGGALLRREL